MHYSPKLTMRLNHGAKIEIHARRWYDAWKAYARLVRFTKKAERTARYMERINELSSRCMKEWTEINLILDGLVSAAEPPGREKAETSSRQSEETAACSEDK